MATSLSFLLPVYRQRVLSLLLLHPQARYHVREIARLTHTPAGSLHRELANLAKSQVLLREMSGNQLYYQANIAFPIYEELASILRKTSGLVDVLANALAPLAKKIEVAFVFGSAAQGKETIDSDVDVLIIGDLGFVEVVTALYDAQGVIGREINPKIYKRSEWNEIKKTKSGFVDEIMNKQKLFIIGKENDLK